MVRVEPHLDQGLGWHISCPLFKPNLKAQTMKMDWESLDLHIYSFSQCGLKLLQEEDGTI